MTAESVPVTVIAGYLGAGKTTLLNHLLRSADERIAVIVNDIGDVNIDAELIESNDGSTIALTNGCLCCSLVDGLDAALETLATHTPRPERIAIEASGAALPAAIAAHAQRPGFTLDGLLVVVDAANALRQARDDYIADVIADQVRSADLLILNKIDLVDHDRRDRILHWLRTTADAPIVEARDAVVGLDVLLGLDRRRDGSVKQDLRRPAHAVRTTTESWSDPVDRTELVAWLDALPSDVVRVKGVVRLADAPDRRHVVQQVGHRRSIAEAGAWDRDQSELVVISIGSPSGGSH